MREFTEIASCIKEEPVIFPDPSTCELVLWLQSKQPDFLRALEMFGRRHNMGIERRRKGYADQFTGADLCSLAVGIQEEALLRRYGGTVQTFSYFLSGYRRDVNTYGKFSPESIISHWILVFKATAGNGAWYFSDPTYRQFLISVDPNTMLIGLPADHIEGIYGTMQIYRQKKAADPKEGERYKPRSLSSGRLFHMNLETIKDGQLPGVTENEYLKLLEAFS